MNASEFTDRLKQQQAEAPMRAAEAQYRTARFAAEQIQYSAGVHGGSRVFTQVHRTDNGAVLTVASNNRFPARRAVAALTPQWQRKSVLFGGEDFSDVESR